MVTIQITRSVKRASSRIYQSFNCIHCPDKQCNTIHTSLPYAPIIFFSFFNNLQSKSSLSISMPTYHSTSMLSFTLLADLTVDFPLFTHFNNSFRFFALLSSLYFHSLYFLLAFLLFDIRITSSFLLSLSDFFPFLITSLFSFF